MLPVLSTERLRLEPVSSGDLDRLHGLLIHPDVRRYLCDDAVLGRTQVQELMQEAAALATQGLGLWSLLADNGAWIGILGLQPVAGAASEAYPAFAGAVEPLIALVDEPNARSHKLLERIGFVAVGTGARPRHPLRAYSLALAKRRLDSAGAGG